MEFPRLNIRLPNYGEHPETRFLRWFKLFMDPQKREPAIHYPWGKKPGRVTIRPGQKLRSESNVFQLSHFAEFGFPGVVSPADQGIVHTNSQAFFLTFENHSIYGGMPQIVIDWDEPSLVPFLYRFLDSLKSEYPNKDTLADIRRSRSQLAKVEAVMAAQAEAELHQWVAEHTKPEVLANVPSFQAFIAGLPNGWEDALRNDDDDLMNLVRRAAKHVPPDDTAVGLATTVSAHQTHIQHAVPTTAPDPALSESVAALVSPLAATSSVTPRRPTPADIPDDTLRAIIINYCWDEPSATATEIADRYYAFLSDQFGRTDKSAIAKEFRTHYMAKLRKEYPLFTRKKTTGAESSP